MRTDRLAPQFVEFIPEAPAPGKLYISIEYGTALHKCCCGCGNDVVTPITPNDWKVIYDGVAVSLHPSIGNWHLPCQSHYWIEDSRVIAAPKWTKEQVQAARTSNRVRQTEFFELTQRPATEQPREKSLRGVLSRLWRSLRS